jgi:hypothetical protein
MSFRIRASALPSWNDCPRRESASLFSDLIGELDTAYRLPSIRNNIGAAVGTGAHKGAAHGMKMKRDGNAAVTQSEIEEVGILEFRTEIAKDQVFYDDVTPNVNRAESQIRELTRVWYHEFFPDIDPVYVEHPIQFQLDEMFELTGQPDIIDSSPTISDYKFGSVSRKYQAQLGAYAFLALRTGILPMKPATLNTIWIPRSKPGKSIEPCVFSYPASFCLHAASDVARTIAGQVSAFIKNGKPESFPANPMSMLCSNKYCRAWGSPWCGYGCK